MGTIVSSVGERLFEERERLGQSQQQLADACGVTMRSQRNYEKGERQPDASYLAAAATAGVDVLYVLTGQRGGDGIGESAVHQAVLDAIDLLSLGKKVDADQLARAVVKLSVKSAAPQPAVMHTQNVTSNKGQITQSGDITVKSGGGGKKK